MGGEAVERRREPCPCLRGHKGLGDIALMDPYLGTVGPECRELGDHPHAGMGFGPRQKFGWADLVVHGMCRVPAAVAVVDHDGREDATRPGVDGDVLEWCRGTG